jgi:ribosomal protein L13E
LIVTNPSPFLSPHREEKDRERSRKERSWRGGCLEEIDDASGEIIGVKIEAEGGAGKQADGVEQDSDLTTA